jgi:mRNA-degrading endonuclease RelE of RelBE toxin-antitoxin system
MVHAIQKLLRSLTSDEQAIIVDIIENILANNLKDMDCKKLKGSKNIFRVRKGAIRIIFVKNNDEIRIQEIHRRNEKTYRNF